MPGNTLKRDVIVSPKALNQDTDHPAVFPESVVERLVHLTTDTGDVVLDPFVGSGTTCVVAKKNGRDYIGIDINETFCNTARMRLDAIPLQYRIENWNKGLLESTGEVK
jgi:DNA modification methylase